MPLTDRQQRILDWLINYPESRISGLKKGLKETVSTPTLNRDLRNLVEQNILVRSGTTRNIRYRVSPIHGARQDSLLNRIKSSVNTTAPGALLVLYGSYARGEQDEYSDIDLLILVDKDKITGAEEKRISYPLYDIEFDTGTIISPLILSKNDWESRHRITPFYHNVLKEGIVL
jgi:predicted nucleotidyltransferase